MRERRDMTAEPAAGTQERLPTARGTLILRDTGRVEALSDGVFAVAATLLVLNLQPPDLKGNTLVSQLLLMGPKLVVYVMSFGFILIMWINHHNMFRL
ncbi:MAG TPA: TMEM175 family protein, partial [Ktedonobacterales bacterium]|nr:TMEM175 family protein [Ktedonobacterales bacterium]